MVDATKIFGEGTAGEELSDPDRMRREYYGMSDRSNSDCEDHVGCEDHVDCEDREDGDGIEECDGPVDRGAFDCCGDRGGLDGCDEGEDGEEKSDEGGCEEDDEEDDNEEGGRAEDGSETERNGVGADRDERPEHGVRAIPRGNGPTHVEIGLRGEEAAARFLLRRGYDIIARNWKCPAGEADIIAHDGETIVFVEVKTRTSFDRGMPEEAVGPKKRQRYERIAAYFLADYNRVDISVRFDVVALLIVAPDRALVRHHINAFGAA